MKQFVRICALTLCLMIGLPAALATDEIQMYTNVSVPRDAQVVDFGDLSIVNIERLTGYLHQLPNLREVRMFGSRLSLVQLEALEAEFPNVTFGVRFGLVRATVSTEKTAFSTMNTPEDKRQPTHLFRGVRFLKNLKSMDAGHNAIDDLSFLYDVPELRVLILADNYITDLTPIASLEHLEYLELFANRFTDLTPLSGLRELLDLNICYNEIRDVTPLFNLKQLERLWLPDRYLTDAQKAELEAALPDTLIVYEWSRSTSHGWRRHPRYTVIRQIYDTGEYVPFPDIAE